ncbi:MAG: Organic solvent tolerance protein [Deltaproteobacteria bacterium]|nr:Organic solvent tolerance protein [Deltaproteobacteria bacterium]
MRRLPPIVLSAVLALGLLGTAAFAQDDLPSKMLGSRFGAGALLLNGPVNIDADTLDYDEEKGVVLAEGNVEVTLGPRKMRADRIRYEFGTGEAELAGKVAYKDADEQFAFDRITINLGTETGVLYNGNILISTNNYRISGERIEKTGKQSFNVEKGSLTTCPCDPKPDWEFDVRKARVVIEGYAVSKDVTVRVRGVPVFWLPYGVFPVKTSRQSGFLMPSISSSDSRGLTLSLPYYWAINRWSDATLTVDAMTERGVRPEVEYRFVPNRESAGAIRGSMFHDTKIQEDRWRVYGENVFHTGEWTANARVEIPSDNQYYVDFAETEQLRSARHARSDGFVGRSGEDHSQQLSVTWHEELEQYPGDNTVQRLPEYQAALLPYRTPIGGVEVSGEMAATFFYRKVGGQAERGRGSTTLSRTFVPYPSVSFTPYLSANLIGNRFEEPSGEWEGSGRVIPMAGVTLAVEAQRNYLTGSNEFVHVVGSDIGYRHVQRVEQDTMPVIDRWSRIAPQDQFVFTVAQRFLRLQETGSPREIAYMHIEWAYDVNGRDPSETPYVDPLSPFVRVLRDQIDIGSGRSLRTNESSDIYGKLVVKPIERWSIEGETLFDPVDGAFSLGAVGVGWTKDEDRKVNLGYRMTRGLAEDVRAGFTWRPLRLLRLRTEMNYSLRNSELTDGSAGLTLMPKSDCWSVGFLVQKNTHPDDTSYRLVFGLKGIGSVGN